MITNVLRPVIRGVNEQGLPSLQWISLCAAITLAPSVLAQTPSEPQERDPNEPSGWLQLEIAVLTDSREQTLASEFWPPYPEVSYPSRFRWLDNVAALGRLEEEWSEASLEQTDTGAIALRLPDPDQMIADAISAEREAQAQAALLAENTESWDKPAGDTLPDPDPLAIDEAALTAPAIDDVTLYANTPETADSVTHSIGDSSAGTTSDDGIPEPEAAPALPTPFRWRQPEQLAQGINAYLRATPDRLRYQAAWLQPPQAANLPILLDPGEYNSWPELQGYVQLRRGETLRLGINLWLNTSAAYYPESYAMVAAPAPPARITWRAAEDDRPLTDTEARQRQQRLARFHSAIEAGVTPMSFVDRRPNSDLGTLSETSEIATPELGVSWPWRHLIHVADTRTLPEDTVRYFDHPVIKVIATWRELTWGEVYALGDAERSAACEAAEAINSDSVGSTLSQCNVRVGNATSAP
jgi:hypothetical protein